ncbi:MAG: MFS transporter [Bryobacterales bacterium]|nr:MFS transporter [Bryobacterales bacterium]
MAELKGTPRQGLVGATIGFFVGFAAVALFGSTAARFREVMGLGSVEVGFLIAMPALSGSLLRIPFAAWVDTTGGRKPFLLLLFLSLLGMGGLAAVVTFLYPDHLTAGYYPLLLLLALLSGCGIAVFSVGASQVAYWHPKSRQGVALALFGGIGNLAPGFFSMLIPIALASIGLAWSYLGWLILLLVGTIGYWLYGANSWFFQLREQGLGVEEATRIARQNGQELFPTGNIKQSLVDSAKTWRTWSLVLMYFTTFGGFVALTAWFPTYWTEYFGLTPVAAGSLTALFAVLTSGVRVIGGMLSDSLREGGENTAVLGLLIMMAGSLVMVNADQYELAIPGVVLLGFGMGICNAAVFKLVPHAAPGAVGGVVGWVGGMGALGGFLIPPMMAFAVGDLGKRGYEIGFIIFIYLCLASLAMAWIFKYINPETNELNDREEARMTAMNASEARR